MTSEYTSSGTSLSEDDEEEEEATLALGKVSCKVVARLSRRLASMSSCREGGRWVREEEEEEEEEKERQGVRI